MDDLAGDHWVEDIALVSDLGDPSHDNFTMVHVWDIEVGVLFHTGAGQSFLGFLSENKRIVGIVNNKITL